MSLKERRVEVEAGEQMTPDEFRRWVIEPVTKALSNNENRKQAKAPPELRDIEQLEKGWSVMTHNCRLNAEAFKPKISLKRPKPHENANA